MNDRPNWRVAHLDEIERRGRDIPVREHLGIHAFGVNAFGPGEDGALVGEHDESGSGQEELYVVLDGTVTFTIDGQAVDAQPGTLVSVGPGVRRKATGTVPSWSSAGRPVRRIRGSIGATRGRCTASRWRPTVKSGMATRWRRCAVRSSTCPTTRG